MCKSAILIATLLAVLLCPNAFSEQKDEMHIWIVLFRIGYAGKCKGYVAKDRICVSNGIGRFLFLPPNYDQIILVSDESKLFLKMPFDQWLSKNPNIVWKPWKTVPTDDLGPFKMAAKLPATVKCNKYKCTRETGKGEAYFVATRSIPANDGVCKVCCKFCGAPVDKGLPILFLPLSRRRNCSRMITSSMTPSTTPHSTYEIPKDYKQTSDETEFYLGGDDMDVLFRSTQKKK
jgi:hypothetical protein